MINLRIRNSKQILTDSDRILLDVGQIPLVFDLFLFYGLQYKNAINENTHFKKLNFAGKNILNQYSSLI